ncbi:hypothetical protein ACQJBY_066463 [Aegilops geniculata]
MPGAPKPYPPLRLVMPPRPSLQSLLLMAASTSAGAGGSGLLAAARRRFPAAFAALGGQRIRLLHSFSSRTRLPRRPELACWFGTAPATPRSRNGNATVRSMEDRRACEERIGKVIEKMKTVGIDMSQGRIGAFQRMTCPKCKGGQTKDRSLSVFIRENGTHGNWTCFRASCGWKGYTQPDGVSKAYQANKDAGNQNGSDQEVKANQPVKVVRKLREEDLCLEPLCDELVTYFSERMISAKTLRRNNVSQRKRNDKIVIAFTYRRDEVLVGCKYREVSKRFSQEANTEKILYGLDDIKQAHDVIIVEGEIDKLSMEEAGYRNCVSVPHGAPAKVSKKLPDKDDVRTIF